jgi:RNA polymerase sigma factor (sigma-70 family)
MARRSVCHDLPNQLATLLRFGVVGDLSDGQLVQRFLTARDGADQAAFAALVERHAPMVLGVCRNVLGNAQDAEDAFQATFLVLARKAGSVRNADSLAGWLHRVARRIAIQAKAEAARRRVYERRSAAMKTVQLERQEGSSEGWPELHEAIARLPEHYREPVVLCYLEGITTEEAASRIGCPQGTILSRLSRARERLRGQLERFSLASPTTLLATRLNHRPMEALPAGLLDSTVRAAIEFAGRPTSGVGLASASATILAKGLLHTMGISKLKIPVAMVLACGGALTFAQIGGFGSQPRGRTGATAEQRQSALDRSMNKLQFEPDESVRRNNELQKALQEIRAEQEALRAGQPPPPPTKAVSRFADVLKRHPARRVSKEGEWLQLYMMDLVEGGTTLLADETDPGLNWCATPKWSHDGTRIFFAAYLTAGFPRTGQRSRIKAIEIRDGLPTCRDLGAGNAPTLSPNDKRIVFQLRPEYEPAAEAGVWVMQADGSERRRVSEYCGAPFWSPDGREILINDYPDGPTTTFVINLETKEGGILQVAGHQIFSWPSWVGPGTLVSALASGGEGNSIALLDVRKPAEAKIIEVLWKRNDDLDVTPRWPIYHPEKRRCIFIGVEPGKRTLYSFQRGESGRVKRLEPRGYDDWLSGLSFSPDGRYLLFCGNRPAPQVAGVHYRQGPSEPPGLPDPDPGLAVLRGLRRGDRR